MGELAEQVEDSRDARHPKDARLRHGGDLGRAPLGLSENVASLTYAYFGRL